MDDKNAMARLKEIYVDLCKLVDHKDTAVGLSDIPTFCHNTVLLLLLLLLFLQFRSFCRSFAAYRGHTAIAAKLLLREMTDKNPSKDTEDQLIQVMHAGSLI